MSALLPNARVVAVVGNGPVSSAAAAGIDRADVVIRMNHARLCGVAGRRTDVLAVNEIIRAQGYARTGRPINASAFRSAREIWLTYSPVAETHLDGRALVFIDPPAEIEELNRAIASFARPGERAMASVGARVVRYCLKNSEADLLLYGFTHQGDGSHNWPAEASWMAELARGGRVRYATTEGPPVRETLAMILSRQSRRAVNHLRSIRL